MGSLRLMSLDPIFRAASHMGTRLRCEGKAGLERLLRGDPRAFVLGPIRTNSR
jgi:hypothetical protein